ncbi:GntR family transcriptional regulator [Sphingobium rhizovicinum]|uniref:GntR family transcriptional regulator n=1 Tax=Sphingobium rhizovicinum TaxID=432308 RepID=A0ABV7NK27_9SPHN
MLVTEIREMIEQGELKPGEKISEPALCQRFDVSRTPLREALKVLAFEGLVLICPPLSGPETMIVWTTKGTMNAEQEAQAGRDYRQAA